MQSPGQLEDNVALEFLTSRIDYERALAVPYGDRDFRLDRMRELLARLGNPQRQLKIVHIAGTKGKGSTAAMLAGMLSAAGYRTGLYSSPHMDRVEERLTVDGRACPADVLGELIAAVRPAVDAIDSKKSDGPLEATPTTYFEIVTALALLYFARQQVDATVLEVGMGGRLDSTNVCEPLVSVITSISFDHTQQLGTTLAAIAGEKAGIIKQGVPVVSGVLNSEPRDVIAQTARAKACRLIELGRDFSFVHRPALHLESAASRAELDFEYGVDPSQNLQNARLSLVGHHQGENAAVALATLAELRRQGFNVSREAARQGLREVRWPARIEVLRRRPTIVLDAAHNVASVQALLQVLRESFASSRRLLVFATTRDKDLRGMLKHLLPAFDEVIFTRYWSNPRGVPPEEIAMVANEIATIPQQVCIDPATSWRVVQQRTTAEDLVCIAGSFFIAAEMRAAMAAAGTALGDGKDLTTDTAET